MNTNADYIHILESEMQVAVGCTEPVCAAYAAALARSVTVDFPVEGIDIICSGNLIKNAMGVRIPGTNEYGIAMAAALGALAGNPDKKLAVLETVDVGDVEKARGLCASCVTLSTDASLPALYIDVTVHGGGVRGRAVLQNYHDCLVRLERNGETLLHRPPGDMEAAGVATEDIGSILRFVAQASPGELRIVAQGIELNAALSREGMEEIHGLAVGRALLGAGGKAGLATYAAALTAAGSDARMAGVPLPAMSNSGSGNQGICATMPVVAAAAYFGATDEVRLRACALSNLVAIHVKKAFGRLSPLCGAVAAGIGASTGIVYMMGGSLRAVRAAIQNMLGNVTGMLCDGAKSGCAMKVATCVFAAVQCALIAMNGSEVGPIEGIIEEDVEATIGNISRISAEGMPNMDAILLNIMTDKKRAAAGGGG